MGITTHPAKGCALIDQHTSWPPSASDSGKGAPFLARTCRRTSEGEAGSFAVPSMGQGATEIHQDQLLWQQRCLPVPSWIQAETLGPRWAPPGSWGARGQSHPPTLTTSLRGNKLLIGASESLLSGHQSPLPAPSLWRSEGTNGRVLQVETKARARGELRAPSVSQDIPITGQTDEVLGTHS